MYPYAGRSEFGRPRPGQGLHRSLGGAVQRADRDTEPGDPRTQVDDRSAAVPGADPWALALSTFGALHGGLMLIQTMQSIEPLEAALTGALTVLRAAGAS